MKRRAIIFFFIISFFAPFLTFAAPFPFNILASIYDQLRQRALELVGGLEEKAKQEGIPFVPSQPISPPPSISPTPDSSSQGGISSQGTPSPAPFQTSSCPSFDYVFDKFLQLGSQGCDAAELQSALATDPSLYPEKAITGTFDTPTENAVKKFQTRQNLATSGDCLTTGYGCVGSKTRAKLNEVFGGGGASIAATSGTDSSSSITVAPPSFPTQSSASIESTESSEANWTLLGPSNGMTNTIEFTSDGTMFVGTRSGGVFKMVPGASSMTPFSQGLGSSEIQHLKLINGILYAAAGDGIYQLRNNIWVKVFSPSSPSRILKLAYSVASGKLWALSDNGLYFSNDGLTWNLITSLPISMNQSRVNMPYPLLASKQGSVYAGDLNVLYKSINNGQSWETVFSTEVNDIVEDDSGIIYISETQTNKIYKKSSTDTSFQLLLNVPVCGTCPLAFYQGKLFVGTYNTFRIYTDGGNTFKTILSPGSLGVIGSGFWDIRQIIPSGANSVFLANDNGVSQVALDTSIVTKYPPVPNYSEITSLALSPVHDIFMTTYWDHNSVQSNDKGLTWFQPKASVGSEGSYLFMDPNGSQTLITPFFNGIYLYDFIATRLWQEPFGPNIVITNPGHVVTFDISKNPTRAYVVYDKLSGSTRSGALVSLNMTSNSASLDVKENNLPFLYTVSIAIDPKKSSRFLILADNKVYESLDGATTWKQIFDLSSYGVSLSIVINPFNSSEAVVAGFLGNIIFLKSGQVQSINLPYDKLQAFDNEVYDVVYDDTTPNVVYAASPQGFFYSTDNGVTWKENHNGLYSKSIRKIIPTGDKIYIGTWGSGNATINKSAIFGASPPTSITSTFVLTPPSATIQVGSTQTFEGRYDSDGPSGQAGEIVIDPKLILWGISSPVDSTTIASIQSPGIYKGVASGTVTASGTYKNLTGTAQLTVTKEPPPPPPPKDTSTFVIVPDVSTIKVGESVTLEGRYEPDGPDGEKPEQTISGSNMSWAVPLVDGKEIVTGAGGGTFKGVAPGTVKVSGTVVVGGIGEGKTATATINVVKDLVITTPSLPEGVEGAYYVADLDATGGLAPLTWSLTGTLPPLLDFDKTEGKIFGTPLVGQSKGTWNITVTVKDTAGTSVSKPFTLVIQRFGYGANKKDLAILTESLPDAQLNQYYEAALSAEGGDPHSYYWSMIGNLPEGVKLYEREGKLAGIPTTSGIYRFILQVSDALGNIATKRLSFTVGPLLPRLRITPENASVKVGETLQLGAIYDPDGSGPEAEYTLTGNESVWQSSDSSIATVTNGLVNGNKPDNVRIITAYHDLSAQTPLTVDQTFFDCRWRDKRERAQGQCTGEESCTIFGQWNGNIGNLRCPQPSDPPAEPERRFFDCQWGETRACFAERRQGTESCTLLRQWSGKCENLGPSEEDRRRDEQGRRDEQERERQRQEEQRRQLERQQQNQQQLQLPPQIPRPQGQQQPPQSPLRQRNALPYQGIQSLGDLLRFFVGE